ncbi:hypothetical protein AAG747_03245 [Rapidithrix thailandica]|uniref:Bacterial surface antigen (D15) domain-containing protein n=1 Tax=Rapidithrix thailandica TaxID=413964 RepID=A0AAW9S1W8_9BACT
MAGQSELTYQMRYIYKDKSGKSAKLPKQSVIKDSTLLTDEVQSTVDQIHEAGFLLASVDSISLKSRQALVYFSLGERYHWIHLSVDALPKSLRGKVDLKLNSYHHKPVSLRAFAQLKERILAYAENVGYPFAKIGLQDISMDSVNLSAKLIYESGPLITFDSLMVSGDVKVKNRFLLNYLKFKSGEVFNQQKIDRIPKGLLSLAFLRLKGAPVVSFQYDKAFVQLHFEKQKANKIDGLIGFTTKGTQNRKLQLTGQFLLELNNLFASGKKLFINWQQFKSQSQSLSITYNHPSLLNTPLDVGFHFSLFKEDSSFQNIRRKLSIGHRTSAAGTISFNSELLTSTRLRRDTVDVAPLDSLHFMDSRYLNYGVSYELNHVDDQGMPRKGFTLGLAGMVGNKKILVDPNQYSVEQKNLKSVQFALESFFQSYYPLGRYSVLMASIKSGKLFGKQLYLNDFFRLGGLKTIRGFNENLFFASGYVIGSLEERFYFANQSMFFLFLDWAYITQKYQVYKTTDYPFGFGSGISFETKNGVFSFVYALGKSKQQALDFKTSKVHIGYTSRF